MENYISARELRRIADVLDAARGVWDILITTKDGISTECDSFELTVSDVNGDQLGYVRWGDDGPAFYPDMVELSG